MVMTGRRETLKVQIADCPLMWAGGIHVVGGLDLEPERVASGIHCALLLHQYLHSMLPLGNYIPKLPRSNYLGNYSTTFT
jgi:hypothetical protein